MAEKLEKWLMLDFCVVVGGLLLECRDIEIADTIYDEIVGGVIIMI